MENRTEESNARRNPAPPRTQTTPQLSCELCRDRKVKCDKLDPCSNCVSSGATCVPIYRHRLPRGRHAHRPSRASQQSAQASAAVNEDLHERLHRLEALISSMSSATPASESRLHSYPRNPGDAVQLQTSPASEATSGAAEPVDDGNEFWQDLSEQIHGLRGVIDMALGEADEDSQQVLDPAKAHLKDGAFEAVGLGQPAESLPLPRHVVASENILGDLNTSVRLCEIYLQQIDPFIKILHRPTLNNWIVHGKSYLGYPDGHPSTAALRAAVHYCAVCSMSERQCKSFFQVDKSIVIEEYQKACEAAIQKSGFLTTRDVTVLQAFVLYLVGRRTEDRTRAVWTLIPLAIRTARALRLNKDSELELGRGRTFFEQQMRARLWLTICLMDLQATFIQASEPLVGAEEAAMAVPFVRHVNDSDFDTSTTEPVPDRQGLTDTTTAMVTYQLQAASRKFNFVTGGKDAASETKNPAEDAKLHAQLFEAKVLRLLDFCDPESSAYAWMTWHGAQTLIAGARVAGLRPMRPTTAAIPPTPRLESDTKVLEMTLQALENVHYVWNDPRSEGFRWYLNVPWHALAIALAECYICTDVALIRRAWSVIEPMYREHESRIAKYSGGKLRGPLGKLMRLTHARIAPFLSNPRSIGMIRPTSVVNTHPFTSEMAPQTRDTVPIGGSTGLSWASTTSSASSAEAGSVPEAALSALPSNSGDTTMWDSNAMVGMDQPNAAPVVSQELWDSSWTMWNEFLSGISADDLANTSMFFDGANFDDQGTSGY